MSEPPRVLMAPMTMSQFRRGMAPTFGTYCTPTKTIPIGPERTSTPAAPPPLVSASWLRLLASLAGRRNDDVARREALEAAWRALPFDFGLEVSRGRYPPHAHHRLPR